MAMILAPAISAGAQNNAEEKFSVKATADITLVNMMSKKSALPEMSSKPSSFEFGADFGWTFWKREKNSLEANLGLGYERISWKASLPALNYHYNAPAAADMDNETYVRYYSLSEVNQKMVNGRLTLPVYLNYRYQINERFSIHALAGVKMGFSVSSKVGNASGKAFSYGIYPQYDDLMIDASYLNEFGESVLNKEAALKPKATPVTASLMVGAGAEVRIWGPLAANLTIKYEGGLSNEYKSAYSNLSSFEASNVPVKYTVAEGQTMTPLTAYMKSTKLSRLSCAISLVCRF